MRNAQIFRGINVVSISVTDIDKAREFYGAILGFGDPVYDLPDAGWIEFQTGGGGNLSVVMAETGWQPTTGTTVVLNVDDCQSAMTVLRKRGVVCEDAETFPGFVTFASFSDPFGNRLQMCSPAPDGNSPF
ncbi:MAG TPA: VOC family protein [Sphingorhabdus sp.]|jgi:predicted enzyme related to lactoylglutathione lyase|nr:VOC family protein [Sphingorhabdus sp.]